MNQKLLFYASAFGVALVLIGLTRLTTTTGGLLAAAGAYDQYGYNRVVHEFKGTGANWCLANKLEKDCFGVYAASTYFVKWNDEWERGNKEAWVRTPYNAVVSVEVDGEKYSVSWIGNCIEGQDLPTGGTCVWGEYAAKSENGSDVYAGPFGQWVLHAQPTRL